ncbi:MAG: ATP-dependent DNA ligase [Candidatus Woesearchaeota archaeon]
MRYSELAAVYEKLDSTTKRLEKTAIVAELLKETPVEDIEEIMLLLQGRIYPAWDERQAGIASRLMAKAISIASGASSSEVEKEWKKTGDLGLVAESLIRKKRQSTLGSSELTVKKVFSNIRKLSKEEGSGSVDRKLQTIAELLTSAKPIEARYVARTILQDLRIGVGSGAIRDAIASAYFPEDESAKDIVQEAYDLTTDFATVAKAAKTNGIKGLKNIKIRIGSPIKVMLAQKAETIKEAFEQVCTPAEVEYKFDGFRVQIHRDGSRISVFTRRLENVTDQFPEIVDYTKRYVKGDSYILDAEAVGFDPKTKRYLPFQKVSQRIKRKYDIRKIAEEFPVEVNVFDVICLEGKNLINEPFHERRRLLERIIPVVERKILPAKKLISDNEKEVMEFFTESKQKGNEGIMLKNLNAPYKPGARVGYMLKYKQTMETLDLAITGAEWGEGKRSKWLSSFDLACKKGDDFLEIGKASTGLKEKSEEGLSFDDMTQALKPLIISEEGRHVKVKPEIIIEVAYEEIQKSPTYTSGYALRFPRVLRVRDDKSPEDASTIRMVEKLYEGQRFKNSGK